MADNTKRKIETVKNTAQALSDTQQSHSGKEVGEAIVRQVKLVEGQPDV